METRVTYRGNYIHDMTPGPNSSAFTCVAGYCDMENNRVVRYNYPGSMFNCFAKVLNIRNNTISDSYCSSVFDACEYGYFHNDEIIVENNQVEVVNAVLVLSQAKKVFIRNNTFKGLSLYYSGNKRIKTESAKKYSYWYTDNGGVLPVDSKTIIEGNKADFTHYDGNRSIAGTKADYGTGKINSPQKYNNVGNNYGCGILIHPMESKAGNIVIKNNVFSSIVSFERVADQNNLKEVYPHTIRLLNTEKCSIEGNTFNGAYPTFVSPETYSCISIYSYPDEMEMIENPRGLSKNPIQFGSYTIKDNTFKFPLSVKTFAVVSINPRKNKKTRAALTIEELIIKNNVFPKTSSVLGYIQDAPVNIIREIVEVEKAKKR